MGLPWLSGCRQLTEHENLQLSVQSLAVARYFSTNDSKKINKTPSVRVVVTCSDSRRIIICLRRDSYKGAD